MPAKRILWLLLFPVFTVLGIYLATRGNDLSWQALASVPRFSSENWWILGICSLLVYVTDAWRFQICARALSLDLKWRTCIEASIVCLMFSWVTPGGALGAPSAGFILKKRENVGWESALLIAFGKSMTGIAFLLLMAMACVLLGLGPPMNQKIILYPLLAGVFTYGGVFLVCVWGTFFSAPAKRLMGYLNARFPGARVSRVTALFESTTEKLAFFLKNQKKIAFELCIANFSYFGVFVFIAAWIAHLYGAHPFLQVLGVSVVKTATVYVAPTPGGAGISELSANAFYGGFLPAAEALSVVLIFRAFTFYTQIALGLVYFTSVWGFNFAFPRLEE